MAAHMENQEPETRYKFGHLETSFALTDQKTGETYWRITNRHTGSNFIMTERLADKDAWNDVAKTRRPLLIFAAIFSAWSVWLWVLTSDFRIALVGIFTSLLVVSPFLGLWLYKFFQTWELAKERRSFYHDLIRLTKYKACLSG